MELKDIKLRPLLDTLRLEKISDEIYFSKKYSGYVSNSRLGLLYDFDNRVPTVDRFFTGFTSGGYSQAFALGSAIHMKVLQSEYYELSEDIGKPTAKLGAMADELYPIFLQHPVTKADVIKASDKVDYYKGKITSELVSKVLSSCSEYWKKRQENEMNLSQEKEIIYLDNRSLEITKSCVESLNNNAHVQALLHPKKNKLSLDSERLFEYLWNNQLIPNNDNINLGIKKLNINIDLDSIDKLYDNINKLMVKQLEYEEKNS